MVRGLVSEPQRVQMQSHLDAGCQKCNGIVNMLNKMMSVAAVESEYEPPMYAVESARGIFALQQPEKVFIFPRIVGRLVYDSFKDPLPVGVRASHKVARHALYQAADYSLDVRLEHERGTPRVTLVGQITNQKEPTKTLANLPVFLVSGNEILAKAVSNDFGEFLVDYEPRRHMRLYVQPSERFQNRIEVPLSAIADEDVDQKASRSTKRSTPRTH